MREIRSMIESIADTDTTVLIRGESGVGKDLIARAVHAAVPLSRVTSFGSAPIRSPS